MKFSFFYLDSCLNVSRTEEPSSKPHTWLQKEQVHRDVEFLSATDTALKTHPPTLLKVLRPGQGATSPKIRTRSLSYP